MYPSRNALNGNRIKQIAIEEKIDDLERRLKERIEVSSGFAEPLPQSRKMRQALQFFDSAGRGLLNYQEFFQAMTKFNLIGVQREVEALFNRYDEYLTGFLDYKELSLILYGLSPRSISLDKASREVIYKMKATIVMTGGASGLLNFVQQVKRMEGIEQGFVSREDLVYLCNEMGLSNITPAEWEILYEKFDIESNSRFMVLELVRYLKSGMQLDRKQVVLTAFQRLDRTGRGNVSLDSILENYDFSIHPSVTAGDLTSQEAASEMMDAFAIGETVQGQVTWFEFLDYFKGISLAVEDDDYFELMIRNALKPTGGTDTVENGMGLGMGTGVRYKSTHATARRVLVVHGDGREEVIELADDDVDLDHFGMNHIVARLDAQGVKDISDIRILKQ